MTQPVQFLGISNQIISTQIRRVATDSRRNREFTKNLGSSTKSTTMQTANAGFVGIFILQLMFLLLYVLFVRYDKELLPLDENASAVDLDEIALEHKANYPRKFD